MRKIRWKIVTIIIAAVVIIAAVGAVYLLLWKVPVWQVARSTGLTDENRFDRENDARKTLAQILGGLAVVVGLYSSLRALQLSAKTAEVTANSFALSREGHITDRFTKAIEQLGAVDAVGKPKLEVRLGGIYALERIARDSERDYSVIMEVLTAYVREHSSRIEDSHVTPYPQESTRRLRADIQSILTVLGRRELKYDKVPLDLRYTHLEWADLREAHLEGAVFWGAHLEMAVLDKAYLQGAQLLVANLEGAFLHEAHLEGVDLSWAVGLTQVQIDSASGNEWTKLPPLPPGLKRPDRWPQ